MIASMEVMLFKVCWPFNLKEVTRSKVTRSWFGHHAGDERLMIILQTLLGAVEHTAGPVHKIVIKTIFVITMDGWMEAWMDGWRHGWIDGGMDGKTVM